jgi:hypothetical protein
MAPSLPLHRARHRPLRPLVSFQRRNVLPERRHSNIPQHILFLRPIWPVRSWLLHAPDRTMDPLHLPSHNQMPSRKHQIAHPQTPPLSEIPPTRRPLPATHRLDLTMSILVQTRQDGRPGSHLAGLEAAFLEDYGGAEIRGLRY